MTILPEIERNLSAMESSFISAQPNLNIAVVELSGNINDTIMAKAVTLLQQRYPSLRRNTATANPPFRWVEIHKPASFRVVESSDWKLVAEEELKNALSLGTDTLLWRCTLVHQSHDPSSHVLLFMYDHAIGDGLSKAILTNTLLNYYVALSNGTDLKVESLPAHLGMLDHQRQNGVMINPKDVDALVENAKQHNKSWQSSLQSGRSSTNPHCNAPNSFFCVNGNAENLETLLTTSRKHEATVGITLLMAAAWSMAKLERMHNPQKNGTPFTVDMNLDVNERKRVHPSLGDDNVQLFISIFPLRIQVAEGDSFWHAVAKMRQHVKSKLPFTINYQAALEKLEEIGEPFWKADANFSSIGRSPFTDVYGDLKIKNMHHVGTKWCPFFGRFVFLSQSNSHLGYDLVYERSDQEQAKNIISMWSNLTEHAGYLDSQFTFNDFLHEKIQHSNEQFKKIA